MSILANTYVNNIQQNLFKLEKELLKTKKFYVFYFKNIN